MNLKNHLHNHHPLEYDKANKDNNWEYKTLAMSKDATAHGAHNAITQSVPPFSEEAFLEYLVRFVVADDQVWFTNLGFLHVLTHLPS